MGVDVVKYDDDPTLTAIWEWIVSRPNLNEVCAVPTASYLDRVFENAIFEEWQEWAQASLEWSRRRRSLAAASRRMDRVLLLPAVLGLIMMVYYVSRPFPIEHWYVGLASVVLIVPYLTRRMS